MSIRRVALAARNIFRTCSLQTLLIGVFVVQLVVAVGVSDYLTYRNGQRSVDEICCRLRHEITSHIQQHLQTSLQAAQLITAQNMNMFLFNHFDLRDFSHLERQFWRQFQLLPAVSYIYFANEVFGDFVGVKRAEDGTFQYRRGTGNTFYIYAVNAQGERDDLIEAQPYLDSRLRPWYKHAAQTGKAAWSPIYSWFGSSVRSIDMVQPAYNAQGELTGVFGVSFTLSAIDAFLRDIRLEHAAAEVFIMERSGLLVSASTPEDTMPDKKQQSVERICAWESRHPLLRQTALHLRAKYAERSEDADRFAKMQEPQGFKFALDGRRQWGQMTPFTDDYGLDWLLVVLLRETEIMGGIQQNTWQTLLFCGLALLLAVGLAILTARWVSQPLLQLNRAAKALAHGQWAQPIPIAREDEVGELAHSFHHMANRLHVSFGELETKNAKISRSECLLQAIINSNPDLIFVKDTNFRYMLMNTSGAQFLNTTPEAVVGKDDLDIGFSKQKVFGDHEQSFAGIRQQDEAVLQGEVLHIPSNEIHLAGRIFDTYKLPLRDTDGSILGILGFSRDVTEQRRMEGENLHKQQFIEGILKTIPTYISLFDLVDNKVIYLNREVVNLLGYSPEECLRMEPDIVSYLVHPDDMKRTLTAIRTLKDDTQNRIYEVECRVRHKKGHWVWIHRRATAFKRDKEGRVRQCLCSTYDITPHRQTELALEANEKQYQLLVQRVADGIGIIQEGKIVFVNDALAAMLDYRNDELLGKAPMEFFHHESEFNPPSQGEDSYPTETSRRISGYVVTANGREVWLEGERSDIFWEGQAATLLTLRDITERKRKEQQRREEHRKLRRENIRLRSTMKDRYKLGKIIGKSLPMQEVYELILKASASETSVLICGESGTGKELIAQMIYSLSQRRKQPFIPVNCGSIQETLFESEFFGHRKGAFTGAVTNKPGFFDAAHQGTLFLDEVGELTPAMQVKLLRALDGGGYTPVGSQAVKHADIRILSATNRNLTERLQNGALRADFFYRVNVISITVPPLRERKEDIPLLVEHFLRQYHPKKTKPALPGKVLDVLYNFDWPGNIRQLQNVIQRYLTLNRLELEHDVHRSELIDRPVPDDKQRPLREALEIFERQLILKTLSRHDGHKGKTAEVLGLQPRTLRRKLQKYEFQQPGNSTERT